MDFMQKILIFFDKVSPLWAPNQASKIEDNAIDCKIFGVSPIVHSGKFCDI